MENILSFLVLILMVAAIVLELTIGASFIVILILWIALILQIIESKSKQ